MLFATAFRVVVTGAIGRYHYAESRSVYLQNCTRPGADITLTATPFQIMISAPLNLCSNSIGINNAAEFGGTFGSGSTLNRSTDLTIPIAGYTFISEVNAYTRSG